MCPLYLERLDSSWRFDAAACTASKHVSRDFGETGIQKVSVSVSNGSQVAFTYVICRAWKRRGETCRSTLWITGPSAMRGTVVTIEEFAGLERTNIWLRLRTAARPILVGAERLHDYVLGTDFSYADFRFWKGFDQLLVVRSAESSLNGSPVTVLSCTSADDSKKNAKMLICNETGMLLELTWESVKDHRFNKKLSVQDRAQINGIQTPRTISIIRGDDDYMSKMVLCLAAYRVMIDDTLFDPGEIASPHVASLRYSIERELENPGAFPSAWAGVQ